MAKAPEHQLAKIAPPECNITNYPNVERARETYSSWMSGFTEDEVAEFHGITVEEVKKDILFSHTRMPVRTIIAHQNDRNRILVQREQSENFRRLFKEALETTAGDFLRAGVSPAGILKEFREATGMVQKAEPLIQLNQQNIGISTNGQGAITSAEDVIRRVLDRIEHEDSPVIEVEAIPVSEESDSEEDQIPED